MKMRGQAPDSRSPYVSHHQPWYSGVSRLILDLPKTPPVGGEARTKRQPPRVFVGVTGLPGQLNVRLGWWLRNPRFHACGRASRPSLSLRELLYELLGMTTDDKKWVYLSDGGHFENLGVYELVRRRCRFIVACDAGQDGDVTFEDLGNAIERCRADFGVDIEIDLGKLRRRCRRRSERHCAIGTIRYDRLDAARRRRRRRSSPGTLLYIKTSLTGDEPADVLSYAAEHPAFPHESTSDQFFDESQFESYRALGFHAVCERLQHRRLRRRALPDARRRRTLHAGSAALGQAGAGAAGCPAEVLERARAHLDHRAQQRQRSGSWTARCFRSSRRSLGVPYGRS